MGLQTLQQSTSHAGDITLNDSIHTEIPNKYGDKPTYLPAIHHANS